MLSEKSHLIQDTLGIANEYITGEADVKRTASRLIDNGPFGLLTAGEILLEEGTKESEYPAQELLVLARSSYRQVTALTEHASSTNNEHLSTRARSLVRLAQFRALWPIYTKGSIPDPVNVRKVYKQLVYQGNAAIDTLYASGRYIESESTTELFGLVGEIAVLALAQRAYLGGDLQCLALQSMFSEDHGGNCLIPTDTYAWDINTFAQVGTKERQETLSMVRKNTIQVKSNKRDDGEPLGPTLYIKQDLGLSPDEKGVGLKIVRSCLVDTLYNRRGEPGQELNDRTALLKDFLYTTEQITPLHQ